MDQMHRLYNFYFILTSQQPSEVGCISDLILQMKKLRLGEVEWLAQGYPLRKL
jgi:hypothetical protein